MATSKPLQKYPGFGRGYSGCTCDGARAVAEDAGGPGCRHLMENDNDPAAPKAYEDEQIC